MNETEKVRKSFKPNIMASLFIGESAPASGKFFYYENTNLFREMKRVFNADSNFLREFKALGFYLDDLVLEPVNHLDRKEKKNQHLSNVDSLAKRIASYNPEAIVVVGLGIESCVRLAASKSGFDGPIYGTAFPGRPEHKQRFYTDMGEILPTLPKLRANKEEKMICTSPSSESQILGPRSAPATFTCAK